MIHLYEPSVTISCVYLPSSKLTLIIALGAVAVRLLEARDPQWLRCGHRWLRTSSSLLANARLESVSWLS